MLALHPSEQVVKYIGWPCLREVVGSAAELLVSFTKGDYRRNRMGGDSGNLWQHVRVVIRDTMVSLQ